MKNVLVVDTHEKIRLITYRILEKLGYRAVAVSGLYDARLALDEGASEEPFHLVIVDANHPETFGIVEAAAGHASAPMVSALLLEENLSAMLKLKRAGVSGFLHKPFDRATFSVMMEKQQALWDERSTTPSTGMGAF